jgi:carbon-monoxide dehydrogenase medium subunit
MAVCEFTYHRPVSLAEACDLARALGDRCYFLAGGTELLPDFKQARDAAEHLIALDRIPELAGIRSDEGGLRIGALATLSDVGASAVVREAFLPLAEAALTVAGEQIRNQATIGGNFCRAVPCADTPPICIAGEARLRLSNGHRERTLAAETFFLGPRKTALCAGEILVEIQIPPQPTHSGASYQRFSLRKGSALAVASAAARVVLRDGSIESARVVLGAVAPIPLLVERCGEVLAGHAPSEERLARAAEAAAAGAQPITDVRGTAEFRRELVRVLTARALKAAVRRAGGAA